MKDWNNETKGILNNIQMWLIIIWIFLMSISYSKLKKDVENIKIKIEQYENKEIKVNYERK